MATTSTEQGPPAGQPAATRGEGLSTSDARYQAIVEDQRDFVCRFLPDTTLTFVNTAFCRCFDGLPEELIGRRFLELLPEESWAAFRAQLASVTPARPVVTDERVVLRRDGVRGRQHWVSRAFFSERGEVVEFQAVGYETIDHDATGENSRADPAQPATPAQERGGDATRIDERRRRELNARGQTEESLRESDERFRQLAETIREAFWLSEPNSRRLLYVSPAVEQVWGISPTEAYRNPRAWIDAVHPDDRPLVAATLEEQCRGEATDREFRVVHPDGGIHWVRNRGFPVRNPAGELYRIAGIAEDVTERHAAEAALRAAHDYLDNIINCIADPIFVKNRRHELVLVNDAECALIGRPRDEVLGRTDYDFFPKEQVDVFWAMDEAVFETGRENINEEQITDAAGCTRTIVTRKTLYTDRDGNKFIVGIIRDITDRKQVETELLRIRKAVESSSDGVGIADLNLRHVYQNQALYDLLGYTLDEMNAIGGPPATFIDPELARHVFNTLKAGRSWHGEAEMRTAHGTIVPVHVRADAIKDADDRTVALVGIMTDMTERKRAQEADRRHREEMAHAARLSTVGEMASGLAHELAQPLSAILYFARGCITRLEQRRWGIKEARAAISKIATQAERAGEFIHRLKAYVRKGPPNCVPTDLNAVVRDALTLLTPQVRNTRTAVHLHLSDALARVLVDPIQIEQVILNLMRNGIEAMEPIPPGARKLHVSTYAGPGPTACFEVRDAGHGLSSEAADKLFDPFFTTKPNGTGLGLPISRTLIEETYAGRLWVEADTEAGVRAGFSLPAARPDEQAL